MTLDVFTLITANALVGVVLSAIMELFARQHRRYRGFGRLSLAYLALGVGHGLMALRGHIPDTLSILGANGLISLALVFMHTGIQIFRNIKSRYKGVHFFLWACVLGTSYYFGLENPDLTKSIIVNNIIISLQLIICISALFRDKKDTHLFARYVFSIPFGLMLVMLVFRMTSVYFSPPQSLFMTAEWDQDMANFISLSVMVTTSLGFIWMSVDRAEADVNGINVELQESLDTTEKISLELREQKDFLLRTLDTVPIPIFFKDADGTYQNANRAFYEATGLLPSQVLGKPAERIASEHSIDMTDKVDSELLETGKPREYQTQLLFKDGLRHEVIVNKAVFRDGRGKIAGIIGSFTDITERKINEAKVQHMALHDSLTGLPNRNMFFTQLRKALARAKRHELSLGVLYLDLDGFKQVNDQLGHDAGDVVLKVVGKRLKSSTRESDTVCRLGGDEFAVLAEMVSGREAMATLAAKIIQEISQDITAMGNQCRVGASVGIAIYPDHATDLETLMKSADTAMYTAKEQGKGVYYFYGD